MFDALAEQRRFVYLVVGIASIGGVWTALHLPSAIYPELTFPRITIVVEGSAFGARQVVFSITRPIEEAVSIVPGVTRVRSRSIRGGAEINLTFAPSTDMIYALQLVQTRVNQVRTQLPDVEIAVERLTPSLFPVLSYNLVGADPATLYDVARYQIKPVLSRIPGVGRVDVQGSDVRAIEVIADPSRLAAQGLTYDDLAAAIKGSTKVSAVGRMPVDYKQYLIVTAQEAHSTEDIANTVVGHGLRVRDLATVSIGTEDHVRLIAGDGKPAALLNITRQIGGNTLAIADSVAAAVAAVAPSLPPGVRLKPLYDQAALVRDAVRSVRDAMVIGAALAVLVLLIFLGDARITAISASVIPLTLVITVLVMQLVGQTFNLMTLGAMAIAIGLVIDDAVVVTENIVRHFHITPNRAQAVRAALRELVWPVTTSTLTTVVVFLPLRLLEGVVGQFFAALSITLTIAVVVSLVLAMTIIPLLSEAYLPRAGAIAGGGGNTGGRGGIPARVARTVEAWSDRYERSLGVALLHPRRVVVAAVVLVAAAYGAYLVIGTGFLPAMDEGAFVVDYWSPGGTALGETDREVKVMERILGETPEVVGTSRRTGAELGLFATEQNRGDIVARLRRRRDRSRTIFAVIDEVRRKIGVAVPRMRVEFVQILSDVINDLAGAARPVELKLFGADLRGLEDYARALAPRVRAVRGVEDLYSGVSEPTAEMAMSLNAVEVNRAGLLPEQVGTIVAGALLGVNAGEVRLEDRSVPVRVRAPDSVRFNPQQLGALPIVAAPGRAPIPLATLATLHPGETRAQLLRENQQQMIAMTSDVSGRALGDVMADIRRIVARRPPPAGIRLEVGGQYASQQSAFRALLLVLGLAGASVVAVMVIQFRSFVEPLVVLLAAPLSVVGALALLIVTGTALNVSSFMGLILLVGLIVKNGIILLDFTHHRMQAAGLPLEAAIREAARIRLRPIVMTTLCTLFGLAPLAMGIGAGSELQRPLALAVIGGLALSTPITLYMVPTLLVAIRGRGYTIAESTRTADA
ncbi:MAG: efflux RND transporter permease subunit [Gemmatimonadaceae bacterium]